VEKVTEQGNVRMPVRIAGLLSIFVLLSGNLLHAAEELAPYRATEDIVYGHKDGLALTLDVLEPEQNRKGIGVILVSSGSWRSDKSDVPGQNEHRRDTDHWCQGLLKGGFTLFVARHGS